MAKKKKEKQPRRPILERIWKRIVEANQGGPTEAGKINLRSQQWPV
jgi:hypothetical protein